jgi:DNA-binding PadR family transcriptional regulator
MLLIITSLSLKRMVGQQRSSYAILISDVLRMLCWGALKYNELKTAILDLLTTEGWCDSNRIIERARSESGISPSSRAVRMALLRYHRHGLLHREWRRGEYVYRLSDRGARRLVWLRGLTPDQLTDSVGSDALKIRRTEPLSVRE